jgi:hypothetical protein
VCAHTVGIGRRILDIDAIGFSTIRLIGCSVRR